jgi:hypothetical protein
VFWKRLVHEMDLGRRRGGRQGAKAT